MNRESDYGSGQQLLSAETELDQPTAQLNLGLLRSRRLWHVWRWVRRGCYVLIAIVVLPPVALFLYGYTQWDVPSPEAIARQTLQTVVIKYADNTELTRIVPPSGNRTMLRDVDGEVSEPMQDATLAAEDPTFYQNPGFDVWGILRAAWGQFTGSGDSGGSTLSQQYVKLATGNDQHTYTRKFREIVLAYKMNREESKNEILKAYLNTAYYGRGAYGIYAAADAYFHKKPKDLDPSQAALLAGMVQQPTNNDPRVNAVQGLQRWTYVADQMARYRFVSPQQRADMHEPQTFDLASGGGDQNLTANQYFLRSQVMAELDKDGYNEQALEQNGYTVVTTIDPRAQKDAEDAVNTVMSGQPDNLHPSVVAVDPKTGAVRAYYGGAGSNAGGYDYAAAPQQPGSSFKPFVALAGLEQNRGLGELYDGSSPQTIAGTVFANNPGVACDVPDKCGVREAMTKSVNTVFVNMAVQFGPAKVADAAYQAGIPKQRSDGSPTLQSATGETEAGVALGMYPVPTTSMAGAYATFANDGMRTSPRFVQKILDGSGQTVRDFTAQAQPAFDARDPQRNKNLAANVTESLLDVAKHSNITLDGQRPVASKTGTSQYGQADSKDNATAWTVGYTSQISTAVSLSAGDATNPVQPVRDAQGAPVYGASLPGHIWQSFMNAYLTGKPVQQFTKAEPIGQYQPPPPPPPGSPGPPSPPPDPNQDHNPHVPPGGPPSRTVIRPPTTRHR